MLSLFNTGYGLQDQLDGVKNGIAIVATNNTHIAITSGQYVYIQDHSTLAEGLYRATANIAANGTLSGSNVTAVSGGGLNALNSNISNYDLGSFSTLSAFNTALTNYVSTLPVGAERYISFTFSTEADAPFGTATTYFANVKRAQNGNYLCDVRTVLSNDIITGRYRTSTSQWYWNNTISELNSNLNGLLTSYTLLFTWDNTQAETVTVSGSKNIDQYRLLMFEVFTDTTMIGATEIVNPLVARGANTHKIFCGNDSTWASYLFSANSKEITVNRTGATTTKFRCFGID